MKVHVLATIPGLTDGRALRAGEEVELPEGLAISLCRDKYVRPVAEAPAEKRETRGNGKKG